MTSFIELELGLGAKVRVVCENGALNRRALVSDIKDEFCDVIFMDEINGKIPEETNVQISRIKPLFAFETRKLSNEDSLNDIKEMGNVLYKEKDFAAAYSYYHAALQRITSLAPSVCVGAEVVVYDDDLSSRFVGALGLVSLDEGKTAVVDVETQTSMGEDFEVEKPKQDLIVLSVDCPDRQVLARALHMNLSRSCVALGRLGWAVRHAGLAYAMACQAVAFAIPEARDKALADALVLRCRALIKAARPQLASGDADLLAVIPGMKARHSAVVGEISAFRDNRVKSNRKLAKNVAQWVQQSMEIAEAQGMDLSTNMM